MDKKKIKQKTTPEGLHQLVIEELTRRIETGEASSSDLGVAVRFLKDNNISVDITDEENPIYNLLEQLPFDDRAAPGANDRSAEKPS